MSCIDMRSEPIDARILRRALGQFATGVTVITTRTADGSFVGLTCNSFAAVSLDPPLVLWSLRRHSAALPHFQQAGVFAVSVLSASQRLVSQRFAGPASDKFDGLDVKAGIDGCPLIPDALAHFECRTEHVVDGGDHAIFLGRVVRLGYRDGEPLLFSGGRYREIAPLDAQDQPTLEGQGA
jgi:flavin reductase (DIM6/NTAB) family NADH-FMN oxidoreductase RutF